MGFINVALDDAKEAEVVPEGEYDLRIIKAEDGESKKGNPMTSILIKIEDAPIPNAAPVRHWLTYPDNKTPADQRNMRLLDIKRFLTLFGVPITADGFDSEDLVGATARAYLTQEEGDNNGEVYNRIKLPRLKE
jgi:hypothetical protein